MLYRWEGDDDYGLVIIISWPNFTLLYLYHCVWSVKTAHNLTPKKRDNNYSPHPLTPLPAYATTCNL